MEKQSQMDAGKPASPQQGQTQPQRRKAESTQAGGSADQGSQMTGTQFTDWASI